MSMTAVFLIAETGLILVVCIGFLLYLRWQKKKTQALEVEQLLDIVNNQEQARKKQLTALLQEKYKVQSSESIESAACMIEAEKQLLQQFIKQQLEQAPVSYFYQNLCELLDQYIYFIPAVKGDVNKRDDAVSDKDEQEQVVNNNQSMEVDESAASDETDMEEPVEVIDEADKKSAEVSEDAKNDEQRDMENQKAENDNSADVNAEDGKAGESTEIDNAENETAADTEAEPDWGEAFAESGDEIDEDVKSDYETETKKD